MRDIETILYVHPYDKIKQELQISIFQSDTEPSETGGIGIRHQVIPGSLCKVVLKTAECKAKTYFNLDISAVQGYEMDFHLLHKITFIRIISSYIGKLDDSFKLIVKGILEDYDKRAV